MLVLTRNRAAVKTNVTYIQDFSTAERYRTPVRLSYEGDLLLGHPRPI